MKKNQMEIVVKLNVSAEKRRALEMYCTDFAGTMQKDLQAAAEQILTQKYNKSVPESRARIRGVVQRRGKFFRCNERKVIHFFAKRSEKLRETFSLISKFLCLPDMFLRAAAQNFGRTPFVFLLSAKRFAAEAAPGKQKKRETHFFCLLSQAYHSYVRMVDR